MVHSYANKQPSLSVHTVLDEVSGNGTNLIEYASTENRLRILSGRGCQPIDYQQGRSITLAGDDSFRGDLNGRSFVISQPAQPAAATIMWMSAHQALLLQTKTSTLPQVGPTVFALTSPADDEPTVEAFFEGSHPVYEGAQEDYSSQSIIIREKQGSTAATQRVRLWLATGKSEW